MSRILRYVAVGAAMSVGIAAVYGSARWRRATEELESRLLGARVASHHVFDPHQLDALPPPVQRYLRRVLQPGQPRIEVARLRQAGTMNMGEGEEDWKPFTSSQIVTTSPPGFIWNARVRMLPGVNAFVHDAYVDGEGILQASALGLVTVAELRGTPEVAEGELYRYLAEAPWYPTAMLPGGGIIWTPVSDHAAQAELTDRGVTVTVLFRFGDDGLIGSSYAAARGRTVGEKVIPTPWGGRYWSYAERDGVLVPLEAEVSWQPEGEAEMTYWRGTITEIEFE